MIQQILLGAIFLGAVIYLAKLIVRQFRAESGCSAGCGKCGSLNVDEIEARFKARKQGA
jgi:hypothetical protein